MPKEIQIEITQEISKPYSSYVAGNMKEGNILLGKFELNVPDADDEGSRGSRYVVIWSFEILPEYRHRGLGRASYLALEKMILKKYEPGVIYLELPIPQMIDDEQWNPKGFWEKLGYVVTHDRQMRKTVFGSTIH